MTEVKPLSAEEVARFVERMKFIDPNGVSDNSRALATIAELTGRVAELTEENALFVDGLGAMRQCADAFQAERDGLESRVAELEAALADIAGSGPVNERGEPDAYSGWSWCYERARAALQSGKD